jgi:hypothetical protein
MIFFFFFFFVVPQKKKQNKKKLQGHARATQPDTAVKLDKVHDHSFCAFDPRGNPQPQRRDPGLGVLGVRALVTVSPTTRRHGARHPASVAQAAPTQELRAIAVAIIVRCAAAARRAGAKVPREHRGVPCGRGPGALADRKAEASFGDNRLAAAREGETRGVNVRGGKRLSEPREGHKASRQRAPGGVGAKGIQQRFFFFFFFFFFLY